MRLVRIKRLVIGMRINKGFTLIEVLVVLIIIAVMTSVAVLAFGHFGQTRREKMMLEVFSQTIQTAKQQAIITPMVLGLVINKNGYRYYHYESDQSWQPITTLGFNHPNAFVSFKKILLKGYQHPQSMIVFLPNGSVTPFTLDCRGVSHHFIFSVNNNGVSKIDEK